MEKFILKSKEVWVLGLAVVFAFGEAQGFLSFEGIVENLKDSYVAVAPVIALVLRVFWTEGKIKFSR